MCTSSNSNVTGRWLGEPLQQRQEPGTHIVDEGRLVTARLREPHERLQPVGRVCVGPRHADPVDELAQPQGGDVGRVLLLDAGDRAHHGGRGRERGAVGADVAPPDEDGALGIEPGQELRREPRLPDARLAHDREQQRRRGRDHAGERLSEHRQLVVPAHERDRASHRPCAESLDGRCREGLGESLRFHVPLVAERDGRVREVARRGPDEHLARRGRGLQPSRGVDDRPGHEDLVLGPGPRGGLARFDPHPDLEGIGQSELFAQSADARPDRKARAHGAERVVLVHLRQAEDRHHRVADELLGAAAECHELVHGGVVELAEDLAGAFRVEPLREPGRIDQVGEQDGDHLALVGPRRPIHERATTGAEAGAVGQRRAADGAVHGLRIEGGTDKGLGLYSD